MKSLIILVAFIGLSSATKEIIEKKEDALEARTTLDEEEYLQELEYQKRLAFKLGLGLGPLGGFNFGAGLGPGQTGIGGGVKLGPFGANLGAGLGLKQSGLGGGLQLGPLGIGASTGIANGGVGFNANAGLGNNYLGYAGQYSPYARHHFRNQEHADEKAEEEQAEGKHSQEEAIMEIMENQKRLSLNLGGNLGPLGGFKFGAGLGPGQTGLGAGVQLGPLGFKVGGGLGLKQTGLGGGIQLGPLGLGGSTGYKANYGLGLNANAGLGNNYLNYANHYTNHAARHIGAGLGVQLGPIGAGVSTGLGNGGVGFNANAGLGHFLQYGTPAHYSQYYKKPQALYTKNPHALYTKVGPWVTVPAQSRRIGAGLGANLGPIGAGASAGIGHGKIGFSGGFGFGGNYANYGTRNHFQQYYSSPYTGPWFAGPNSIV